MLHNYQYKFLNLPRCRYLRLVVPLCSIFAFLMGNVILNTFFNSNNCYAAVIPTASLSVSNPTLSTTVAPGDTAYLSSNVTYSASDIDSYSLQVSYANGYNSLKLDGGTTTLTGANGTSGSSLANNSWGFAWTNNTINNTSTNAGLTYYTVPTYGTNGSGLNTGRLENATLPESANNTLDSTTKRIVFAAKFAENNNNSGHYKTGVQLSMVATPRKLIGLEKANTMQDLATHPEYCEETPLLDGQKYSAEYKLMDNRAYPSGVSNQYTIRKFADGRCWMTENLRINNTTINAASSDFSGNDIVLPNSAKSDFTEANKFTYRSILLNEAISGSTGYYNWYTATAGAGTSDVATDGKNLDASICPKGWKLPSGGSDSSTSEFGKFTTANSIGINSTGSSLIQNDIYNFKYTGRISDGSLDNGTSRGYWWSSTASDGGNAYDLRILSSYVYPGTLMYGRYNGFAVRCVMRDPDLSEITTMQEMTPRVCNKTAVGTSKTLTDTRDGNAYTIRKFSDNRCWMTDNLLLKGSRTLTPSDSDVKSNYTLPAPLTSLSSTDFSSSNYYIAQSYNANTANSGNTMYYSWTAATAGAGTSGVTSGSVDTSICPKGWKLPSGGSNGEFQKFTAAESIASNNAGSTKVQAAPYNFKYTGRAIDGSFDGDTSFGLWWSSTAYSPAGAYYLYIDNSDVNPGTNHTLVSRYLGFAVRCIARDS